MLGQVDVVAVVIIVQELVLDDVQRRSGQMPGFQRINQRPGVHERPSGSVHEERPLLHLGKSLRVDYVMRLLVVLQMQGDDIAPLEKLVQADAFRELVGLWRRATVVVVQLAAEPGEVAENGLSCPSCADDAYRHVPELPSHQTLESEIVDGVVPLDHPEVPDSREDHHDGVLGHPIDAV